MERKMKKVRIVEKGCRGGEEIGHADGKCIKTENPAVSAAPIAGQWSPAEDQCAKDQCRSKYKCFLFESSLVSFEIVLCVILRLFCSVTFSTCSVALVSAT